MEKVELRRQLLQECNIVGDVEFELRQICDIQGEPNELEFSWSATCSEILTLICC